MAEAFGLKGKSLEAAKADFERMDRLVILRDVVPAKIRAVLRTAFEKVQGRMSRVIVPGYKASEAAPHTRLPAELWDLYTGPLLDAARKLSGDASLVPCPRWDLHALTLYAYTQPGDRIGWHYDTSHYEGKRYTTLLPVVNEGPGAGGLSSSRLRVQLYTKCEDVATAEEEDVTLQPGDVCFFDGDRLRHCVTELGQGELRAVLSAQYVTSTHMDAWRKVVTALKDVSYFGPEAARPLLRPALVALAALAALALVLLPLARAAVAGGLSRFAR